MSRVTFWLMIGFVGQAFFTRRFVIQWLVSGPAGIESFQKLFGGLAFLVELPCSVMQSHGVIQ